MWAMGEKLLEQKNDDVFVLTLNRPEQSNSLDRELVKGLRDAFERIRWDESVKVLILTGSGEKSLCAGIDFKEHSQMNDDELLLLVAL